MFSRRIWKKANSFPPACCWSRHVTRVSRHLSDCKPLCAHFIPHYLTVCWGDDWNVFSWLLKGRPPRRCLTFGRESGFSYMDYSSFVWSSAQMSPQQWPRIGISVFFSAALWGESLDNSHLISCENAENSLSVRANLFLRCTFQCLSVGCGK